MHRVTGLFIVTMLFVITPVQAVEPASEARLDEVAHHGEKVMPFSLDQTTHIFTKTENGGVQQVIVKEISNTEQIKMIKTHLLQISQEFAQGNFSAPMSIHGENMPGLAKLRQAELGQIKIEYKELSNGAQISYSTNDPSLIEALHEWFDAQLSDHARHAIPGHEHHQDMKGMEK
jgi:hypothetical protein